MVPAKPGRSSGGRGGTGIGPKIMVSRTLEGGFKESKSWQSFTPDKHKLKKKKKKKVD